MSKKVSNRKYPPKNCPQCRKAYTPSDRRQIYCCAQCRIDFNNDKRAREDAPALFLKKNLIQNERILKYAYEWLRINNKAEIALDYLLFNGFQPNIFSELSINQEIGTKVMWSLGYGIEGIQRNNKLIKILKR
jgi:hypothetical protein